MSTRTSAIFTAAFIATSLFHLFVGIGGGHVLETVSKVIPIVILIVGVSSSKDLNIRVLLALIFSLCGDIASKLLLPSGLPFLLQISFFACAQICYISEWRRYITCRRRLTYGVLPFFIGIYAALLLGNFITACLQKRPQRLRFIIGAAIFIISDTLIFVRMLTGGFAFDGQLIMLTYYAAQYILTSYYWRPISPRP